MNYLKTMAVSAMSLALLACGGGGSDGAASSYGQSGGLQLSVTDAPVDGAEAVNITFSKVTVKPLNGSPIDLSDLEQTTLNLLDYTGGDSELIINTKRVGSRNPALPAGDYEWMRFYVSEASITIDGHEYPLEIPSNDSSGLKLNRPFSIPANDIGFYTIDFDLRHSIVGPFSKNGQQYYKLKPVLRLVENETVGKIRGFVDSNLIDSCEGDATAAYLFNGDISLSFLDDIDFEASVAGKDEKDVMEPYMSASLATDFSFNFGFVQEGEYTVAFACGDDEPDFDDDSHFSFVKSASVKVSAGKVVEVYFNP